MRKQVDKYIETVDEFYHRILQKIPYLSSMKTIIQISTILFSFLWLNQESFALENTQSSSPPFEVHQVYPYISVSKQALMEANTLSDLKNKNNHLDLEYRSEWVSKYFSVEIQVCKDGVLKSASSKSETFTQEQKELLAMADPEKEVQVKINYLPKNDLVQNEPKIIDFSFSIDPENSARFSNGKDALYDYLQKNAIQNIPASHFENYDMTAIKFSISAAGYIHKAEVFGEAYQSGKFAKINQALLEVVRNMPRWNPASYADGTEAEQSFVLTVGNSENCLMPLLNIGR